jgi:hypothetical protein
MTLTTATPRVGDWVIAVGFGLGGTIMAGIISARGRGMGPGEATLNSVNLGSNPGRPANITYCDDRQDERFDRISNSKHILSAHS